MIKKRVKMTKQYIDSIFCCEALRFSVDSGEIYFSTNLDTFFVCEGDHTFKFCPYCGEPLDIEEEVIECLD